MKNKTIKKHKNVLIIKRLQGVVAVLSLAVVPAVKRAARWSADRLRRSRHQRSSTTLNFFAAVRVHRMSNTADLRSSQKRSKLVRSARFTAAPLNGLYAVLRTVWGPYVFVKRRSHGSTLRDQKLGYLSAFAQPSSFVRPSSPSRDQELGLTVRRTIVASVVAAMMFVPLVFLASGSTPAHAQQSDTLNFQGRLLNASGSLVDDGIYNMQFDLYYVSSGGSSQWTEDRLVTNTQGVTVTNGYFSVQLGEYDALPALDWSEDLWLGMTVRGTANCAWGSCTPTDSEMTPRFKLTAVPHAFTSAAVETADTNSGTTHSNSINISTGNATGATSNSGNITIDVGTATDTEGTISLGTVNTSALSLGNGTATFSLNSSALDISTAGVLSGATGITSSGTINFSGLTASRAVFTDGSSNLVSTAASAALLNSLSDETGTGVAVFGTSPTITTSLLAGSASFDLLNTTATTVNAFGAATALDIGATTGYTSINNELGVGTNDPDGDGVNIQGGTDVTLGGNNGYLVLGDQSGENLAADVNEIQARNNGATTTLYLQADGGDVFIGQNTSGGLIINSSNAFNFTSTNDLRVDTDTLFVDESADGVGFGTASPDAAVEIAGNRTQAAWGLNGIQLQGTAATYTDSSTAGSGTATNAVFSSFGIPTLAATNASVTTTNAANVYIAGAPTAGANQTITNAYALWVDGGTTQLDGELRIGTSDTTGTLLVVDTKTNVGDPTGTNGAIYYNSDANKLRCYENSAWTDCIGAGGSVTNEFTYVVAASDSVNAAAADYTADGTSDEDEINSAIDLASATDGGGTVLLLEGTYTIDGSIDIDNDVQIVGSGTQATIITVANSSGAVDVFNEDSGAGALTNWAIQDLSIDGNSGNAGNTAIIGIDLNSVGALQGSGGRIQNVEIYDLDDSSDSAIRIVNDAINLSITDSHFYDAYYGINYDGAGNEQSTIIANNQFTDIVEDPIRLDALSDVTIEGNVFNSNDGGSGTQGGVDLGSTSAVDNITISDNLFLEGFNFGIRSPNAGNANITVSGNTFDTLAGNGIVGNFTESNITGNHFEGNGTDSAFPQVEFTNTVGATISGNVISDGAGDGILFDNSGGNNTDNVISGNTIYSNSQRGIEFESGSDRNVIDGNTISANTDEGIYMTISDQNIISNNILNNNGGTGDDTIEIDGASDANQIIGNRMTDSSGTGDGINIDASATNTYIADNILSGTVANTITDGSSSTVYATQLDSSGNLDIQAGSGIVELLDSADITGSLTVDGAADEIQLLVQGNGTQGADLVVFENSGGTDLFALSGTGSATFLTATNSTTGFQIQDASASEIFTVDTTNRRVYVGDTTADANADLFIVDTKNTSGDPTGVNGAIYYNSNSNKLRCFENSIWADCIDAGGGAGATFTIVHIPEFGGGTLSADGTNNTGTILADFVNALSGAEGEKHNYYEWSTGQSTAQDYDIVVNVQIPSDYNGNFGAISFWHEDPDGATTTANTDLKIYDDDETQCNTTTTQFNGASAGVWEEETVSLDACTFAANDIITFVFKLTTTSGAGNIRLGEFEFDYDD